MGKTATVSGPKITDQLAELDSLKAKVAEIEKKTAIVKPYQDIIDRAHVLVLNLKKAISECPSLDDVNWDSSGEELEPIKAKFKAVEAMLPTSSVAKPVSARESWLAELETVLNKKAAFDEWNTANVGEGKTFKRLSGNARLAFNAHWETIKG